MPPPVPGRSPETPLPPPRARGLGEQGWRPAWGQQGGRLAKQRGPRGSVVRTGGNRESPEKSRYPRRALERLASILLPGQRAAAAIGSQTLPRDLKCNPRRLKQRRDFAAGRVLTAAGPAPPECPLSQVSLTSPPSTCRMFSGDSSRGIFGDRKAPCDR